MKELERTGWGILGFLQTCFKRFQINHLLYFQHTQLHPVFILDGRLITIWTWAIIMDSERTEGTLYVVTILGFKRIPNRRKVPNIKIETTLYYIALNPK